MKTLKDMPRDGGMDKMSKAELLEIITRKDARIGRLQRGSQALNGSVKRLEVDIIFPKAPVLQLTKKESKTRIDELLGNGLKVSQSMTVLFGKRNADNRG